MESTPALDVDVGIIPAHTPAALSFPTSSSSPLVQITQGADQSSPNPAASSSSLQRFSNGPHIRSRITVVCAECKRLKLKCDRRTPCSSCLKRDTVQRCVYSQAAAEKVDVQTLHNRIIEIERVLATLQAAPPSMSVSAVLTGIPSLKQPAAIAGPSRAGLSLAPSSSFMAGFPCNDRALLAQGASGSSVVINLDDVVSLWLGELEDLGFDSKAARTSASDVTASSLRQSSSSASVKLEPATASVPPASTSFSPGNGLHTPIGGFHILHPPAPYDAFLPPPSAGPSALPQVTAALIAYLPAEPVRSHYMKAFRETMMIHPSFNVPHFEQRIAAIYTWAESGEASSSQVPAYGNKPMSKQELARDLFFAKPGSTSRGSVSGNAHSNTPKPTLSFFAAASAAFALGSLVARDEEPDRADPGTPSPPSSAGGGAPPGTPSMLYALSEQALQLFEKTAAYDLDSVIAMILQVLYMLHEGQMSVAQSVFPLVGKMVNVARYMGLMMDPDEFPGTYNFFEAETRRRIWWDVFYYDLFVSDSMGQPPLIADNSHTTRLPSDVDEDAFTPSCTSLPLVEADAGDGSSVYFGLKCRLAQLVKSVKKQTFRDPVEEPSELSIDQAGAFEGDVNTFLQELPAGFRMEMSQDISKPIPPPCGSSIRLAQKCELAILANRLIVKLYLPFLKEAASTHRPSHQAVFGTVSAAHNVVYAARLLHSVWGRTRPAIFDFYDFGRTLFDAGVVCAHTVIQDPMSIVAAEGMKNVVCAAEILKEIGTAGMGVEGTCADQMGMGARSEAVRIVESMRRKAEAARSGNLHATAAGGAGTKRKHSEVEVELLATTASASTFQLPFVGAAVSSSKSERSRPGAAAMKDKDDGAKGKPDAKKQAKEKERDKDKDRNAPGKYLNGPLRVRPMTGQPAPRKQRTASVSTAAAGTPAPSVPGAASVSASTPRAAPPPPSPLTTTPPSVLPPSASSSAQMQPAQSSSRASMSVSVPESPSVQTPYEPYPPSRSSVSVSEPMQQQRQQPQEDFTMQYSSSPDDTSLLGEEQQRYSAQSSYDSPQSATMYDPQVQGQTQFAQASPASSYPVPPPPPPPPTQQPQPQVGYYLPYSGQAGSGAYDGHHPLAMGMMDVPGHEQSQQQHYMPPPPPTSTGDGAKGHHGYPQHPQHSQHPHSHPQHSHAQRGMEYGAQHGHGHQQHAHHSQAQVQAMAALSPHHVQGWGPQPAQSEPPDLWPEYNKFYGGMGGGERARLF